MPIRLLAIDVDGTLVDVHDRISAPTLEALRRAREAGLRLVLATGRRYRRTLHLSEQLELNAPVISASGALIKDPAEHRTLFCASFGEDILCDVLKTVGSAGHEAVLYGDTFHLDFDFYVESIESPSEELAEYLRKNRASARLWPNLLATPPPDIFAGFAIGTRDKMLRLQAELNERLPGALYLHVLRSPMYRGYMCEIAPAGISKWIAVQRLAREWNIADGEICAVGDDVNDIPMIAGAGLGIAMGNAQPEVKAIADRIAPTLEKHGLAQVIEWLLG